MSWALRGGVAAGIIGVGAALASWGTRDSMTKDSMLTMGNDELCLPPDTVQAAIERGALLHEQSCAGCHDRTQSGVGPSYRVIVSAHETGARAGSVEARVLSALAKGASHPAGGWGTFAHPVSPPPLSTDDRNALAYWMWKSR